MARPNKMTIDYFPHDTDASDGKTLTIIQNKFGNDGYAFWFKLLQLLGKSAGHYYDFNNASDWEFLLAKTHINDTETAVNVLNMLAVLGAIDEELYKNKIIWSQNFVDGIADAYKRTSQGVPQKPILQDIKSVIADNNGVNVNKNPKKTTLMPQTKLNKTKLNKEIYKEKYGEFKNVLLLKEEYKKLTDKFGEARAGQLIETLSAGIRSKGYKYKDHYAAILNWARRDEKEGNNGKTNSDGNGKILKPDEFTDPADYFRERTKH